MSNTLLLQRILLYKNGLISCFIRTRALSTICRTKYKFQQSLLVPTVVKTKTLPYNMASSPQIKVATYNDVKALKDNKTVLLVDVREPSELKETGTLPGSINIPVDQVENILKNLPASEFEKRYGRPKPDLDFPLVFSCRSGKRSEMAAKAAIKLGYKDVTNYSGGWLDWEKHLKA